MSLIDPIPIHLLSSPSTDLPVFPWRCLTHIKDYLVTCVYFINILEEDTMVLEDILKFTIFRHSVQLANISAKLAFLSSCILLNIIPVGFLLKFSLQSGLSKEDDLQIESSVQSVLSNTSLELLKLTKEAEIIKVSSLSSKLQETFKNISVDKKDVVDQATSKFRKIIILRTKILSKKLAKLSQNRSFLEVNFDQEINKFEDNFAILEDSSTPSSSQVPSFDWFDPEAFPPLPPPHEKPPDDWINSVVNLTSPGSRSPKSTPPPLPRVSRPRRCKKPVNISPPSPSPGSCPTSGGCPSTSLPPSTSPAATHPSPIFVQPSLPELYPPVSSQSSSSAPTQTQDSQTPAALKSSPIILIPYSSNNFKPLLLHGMDATPGLISLLSKGPSFSPTPMDPPDLGILQEDILDWKERIRWSFLFRNKKLKDDPQSDLSVSIPFNKPPWYSRTDKSAPFASDEVEMFMECVRRSLISPSNFSSFTSNISREESIAFSEVRQLKQNGISVFLQDKSSRFVLARQEMVMQKVDQDLHDATRYQVIEDDTEDILHDIEDWWRKHRKNLSVLDEDISSWLVNPDSRPGKLKVLLKTHKPQCPVREVFSVCSQPVENLSAFLQYSYLGPIVNSGALQWRLRDTKELIQFLHGVNDWIREAECSTPISLCTVDIKNMFPSIFKDLALPAIKKQLQKRKYSNAEIKAVMDALRIIRDGTRVRWRKEVIKQVDGCSLGPADSCDYCDISLDSLLQVLVPRLEQALEVDLKWLKFYRDDGILIFFGDSNIVLDILKILNGERQELQFATDFCERKNVLGCCSSCPKSLPYLDCTISVYQLELENGVKVPQLKTTAFSRVRPIPLYRYRYRYLLTD